jgi:hypothetical protein
MLKQMCKCADGPFIRKSMDRHTGEERLYCYRCHETLNVIPYSSLPPPFVKKGDPMAFNSAKPGWERWNDERRQVTIDECEWRQIHDDIARHISQKAVLAADLERAMESRETYKKLHDELVVKLQASHDVRDRYWNDLVEARSRLEQSRGVASNAEARAREQDLLVKALRDENQRLSAPRPPTKGLILAVAISVAALMAQCWVALHPKEAEKPAPIVETRVERVYIYYERTPDGLTCIGVRKEGD